MRGQTFVYADYSGGVNLEAQPYAVDSNQGRDSLNVQTSPMGSIRKRNGFEYLSTPGVPVHSLGTYERSNTKYLLGVGDDGVTSDIYSITTGGTQNSRLGAATVTPGRRWDIIQAPIQTEGPVYLLNGLDTPLYWSGSGNVATWTANTGSLPNGKYMTYHDNRLFIAGVETDYTTRSTLYASAIALPRNWATPDAVTNIFDPDDGEEITGLGTVGPYLLVFKPRKTFVIVDTNTLGYRKVSAGVGCVAHRSICNTDLGTFFLSSDRKVCITDGTKIEDISQPIDPILKALPDSTIGDAAGVYHDSRYYLSVTQATVNDIILEFDTRNSSWWIHKIRLDSETTTGAADWAILDPQESATLYCTTGDSNKKRILTAFVPGLFTDLQGGNYEAYWVSGWTSFNEPHIRKFITQIRADAKGEFDLFTAKSFTIGYTDEEKLTWEQSELGSSTFGGDGDYGGSGTFGDSSSQIYESRFYTPGAARAWAFKFFNDTPGEWELYSHSLGVESRTD